MNNAHFGLVFWYLLLASIGVFGRIPVLNGHEINLSAYDLVLPGLFVWAWLTGVVERRFRGLVWPVALTVLILAHAALVSPAAAPAGLLRDTVKLCAVIWQVWMLIGLFRSPAIGLPSRGAIYTGLAVAFGFAVYELYREGWVPGFYDALQTVHSSILCGLFLLLTIVGWEDERESRAVQSVLAACLIATLLYMVAKVYLVVGSAIVAVWFLRGYLKPRGWAAANAAVILPILAMAAVIGGGLIFLSDYKPFSYMHSFGTSFGFRWDLWQIAFAAIGETFPVGTGAGQYGAHVRATTPNLGEGMLLTTHNTVLNLITEFGAAGLVAAAGIGWLVWRSAVAWPPALGLLILVFLLSPIMLHDVLGLRTDHLILALGLARIAATGERAGEG